jgi:hypothetical protein
MSTGVWAEWESKKNHIKTVHENLKPFECKICLKAFSLKWTLKRHVEAKHKNLKPF